MPARCAVGLLEPRVLITLFLSSTKVAIIEPRNAMKVEDGRWCFSISKRGQLTDMSVELRPATTWCNLKYLLHHKNSRCSSCNTHLLYYEQVEPKFLLSQFSLPICLPTNNHVFFFFLHFLYLLMFLSLRMTRTSWLSQLSKKETFEPGTYSWDGE